MMIGAIFIPLMMILNQSDAAAYGEVEKYMVSGTGYNMILILSFCMFAPFLALTLFSFLNKRNRSDFYHSLPHRRETIFISYSLSILTWIIGAIVLSSAVTSLMYWIGSQYIAVNYTSVLVYLFNLICASILVYAATLLAMTITGTSFSNVVTALLIIFLPRLIMTVFANTIVSTV